jgi:hypothetical protein
MSGFFISGDLYIKIKLKWQKVNHPVVKVIKYLSVQKEEVKQKNLSTNMIKKVQESNILVRVDKEKG